MPGPPATRSAPGAAVEPVIAGRRLRACRRPRRRPGHPRRRRRTDGRRRRRRRADRRRDRRRARRRPRPPRSVSSPVSSRRRAAGRRPRRRRATSRPPPPSISSGAGLPVSASSPEVPASRSTSAAMSSPSSGSAVAGAVADARADAGRARAVGHQVGARAADEPVGVGEQAGSGRRPGRARRRPRRRRSSRRPRGPRAPGRRRARRAGRPDPSRRRDGRCRPRRRGGSANVVGLDQRVVAAAAATGRRAPDLAEESVAGRPARDDVIARAADDLGRDRRADGQPVVAVEEPDPEPRDPRGGAARDPRVGGRRAARGRPAAGSRRGRDHEEVAVERDREVVALAVGRAVGQLAGAGADDRRRGGSGRRQRGQRGERGGPTPDDRCAAGVRAGRVLAMIVSAPHRRPRTVTAAGASQRAPAGETRASTADGNARAVAALTDRPGRVAPEHVGAPRVDRAAAPRR